QVYNHITTRIPRTEHLLINPFGYSYDEITPSCLVKIDIQGNKIDDSELPVNKAGYLIHSAIHEAREDINCVIHTHSHNSQAIGTIDIPFIPLTQESCQFHQRVGYHEFEGIVLDDTEKQRLVEDLGADNHTLVLNNHGIITTGNSPIWAFDRLFQFERAAGIQLRALASGQPLKLISEQVLSHTRDQFEGGAAQAGAVVRHPAWPAYYRMMDRLDPNWRRE
ncbi:MAG: ribulose-5-phosphate 4-epimerase/fuculose-1-phosphate aldolase, partial [Parasphingorhabdus sp.]